MFLWFLKSALDHLMNDDIEDGDDPLDHWQVTSGCRPGKFLLHVVADQIFCDYSLLSMKLIVYEIARLWSVQNTIWLLDNPGHWDSRQGKFRIRNLMVEDMKNDLGVFKGRKDTMIDEMIYTKKRFFCAPGAVKTGSRYPLHVINIPRDLNDLAYLSQPNNEKST